MKMEHPKRLDLPRDEQEAQGQQEEDPLQQEPGEAARRPLLQKGVTVSEIFLRKPVLPQTCTKSPQVTAVYVRRVPPAVAPRSQPNLEPNQPIFAKLIATQTPHSSLHL